MKNRILIFSLIIWVFCGVLTSSYFSTNAVSPEEKSTDNSLQNNPQFSTSTSYDDLNVYATSTLSESSPSGLSYRVTTMITSPSGRTNTMQSDWSPAPITYSSGLSIGNEDGTYNVQATFESQSGTYDEYDSFDGNGGINLVGTTTSDVFLLPRIGVRAIRIIPTVSPGNTVNTFNATIEGDISFDVGVNVSNVRIGLNRLDTNQVNYDVGVPFGTGVTPVADLNRAAIIAANPGGARRVSFPITFENNSPNGTVIESIRIDPSQFPMNTITVNPEEQSVTFNFVRPTPTPTPNNNGGGGGGGGPISENCFCAGGNTNGLMSPGDGGCSGGGIGCPQGSTGSNGVCCWYNSPIILDIDGDGFDMTSYSGGVEFDISGRGYPTQTSWTAADSDDAWLVLDRNENNRIDSGLELFGDACEQPAGSAPRNGFSALAEFDRPEKGGNADGKITRRDAIFRKLRLWQDRNHNGISEAEELSRLPALDVVAIRLDFKESRRTDAFGNKFKYWAKVRDRADARVGRKAYDVFLVISPPRN